MGIPYYVRCTEFDFSNCAIARPNLPELFSDHSQHFRTTIVVFVCHFVSNLTMNTVLVGISIALHKLATKGLESRLPWIAQSM